MTCLGCERKDHIVNTYGDWCDDCGGVMRGPGLHYVRLVARLNDDKGRLDILWDTSGEDYSVMLQRLVKTYVKIKEEWVQGYRIFVHRGTLDSVIGIAVGALDGNVGLTIAPTATADERHALDPAAWKALVSRAPEFRLVVQNLNMDP
jgi:hypothetical protein